MSKHAPGDTACPDLYYWWDETWSRYGLRRKGHDFETARILASQEAEASASRLRADGKDRVTVMPVNIDSRDGFFAVRYSVRLSHSPEFHTCHCPD